MAPSQSATTFDEWRAPTPACVAVPVARLRLPGPYPLLSPAGADPDMFTALQSEHARRRRRWVDSKIPTPLRPRNLPADS